MFQPCATHSPYYSWLHGQKAEKDTKIVNQLLVKANEGCQDLLSVSWTTEISKSCELFLMPRVINQHLFIGRWARNCTMIKSVKSLKTCTRNVSIVTKNLRRWSVLTVIKSTEQPNFYAHRRDIQGKRKCLALSCAICCQQYWNCKWKRMQY